MFQGLPRFRRTCRSVRVVRCHRPRLELLEDRRAPGDLFAGALLANFIGASAPCSPEATFAETFSEEAGWVSALTTASAPDDSTVAWDQPNAAIVHTFPSPLAPKLPQQNDLASTTQESSPGTKDNSPQGADTKGEQVFFNLASANSLFLDLLAQAGQGSSVGAGAASALEGASARSQGEGGGAGSSSPASAVGAKASVPSPAAAPPATASPVLNPNPSLMTPLPPLPPPPPPPPPGSTYLWANGTTFSPYESGKLFFIGSNIVSMPLQGVEGMSLSDVTVTTFADADPNGVVSDYTASINWGDQTAPTTGTIGTLATGGFRVGGTHTYAEVGLYQPMATITDAGGTVVIGGTKVQVADADLTGTAVPFSATEGQVLSNVTLATITDGNPLAQANDFTATINWGDDTPITSGTVTGSNGNFIVQGTHTYPDAWNCTVTVTVADTEGSGTTVTTTATVADPPLTASGVTVTPAAEGSVTTVAAAFTDGNVNEQPGTYDATIDWGDGTTEPATVSGVAGQFSAGGSHVYPNAGSFPVTVTVVDGALQVTQTATVTVPEALLSASGTPFTGSAGLTTGVTVATFTDANTYQNPDPRGPSPGYTATIDWGDGTSLDTNTTIFPSSPASVFGSHVYASAGTYTATMTITDDEGATATATSTATITTISGNAMSFEATEGVAASNVTVATFTDTQAGNYTATIDWGDGSSATNGLVTGSAGSYSVAGSHTYAEGGNYPFTVTVTSTSGSWSTNSGIATVADAPLSATGRPVTVPQWSTFTGSVATFTDAVSGEPVSSYQASIDWGDGSVTSTGTVSLINGVLTVTGSHSYSSQGAFALSVTIADTGGATATASGTATVGPPVLVASPTTFSASEGVAANNVTVATFTDTSGVGGDAATIDWGDDSGTGSGTVTGSGGSYSVVGSHLYMDDGTYTVTVTVTNSEGDTDTAYSTAVVSAASLAATGASQETTELVPTTFTLATLTNTHPQPGDLALIDWGDGGGDYGGIVPNYDGTFSVMGTHTYAIPGSYTIQVTIVDADGDNSATVSDPVTVNDAPVTLWGTDMFTFVGMPLGNLAVATFTDGNPNEPASSFTAMIDWGDGSPPTAGVVSGGWGYFSVSGNHTYPLPPESPPNNGYGFLPTITLTENDDNPQVLTATGAVGVSADVSYEVAEFTDSNWSDSGSDFSAVIDWGDGTPPTSDAVIGGFQGQFEVWASHNYEEEGTYAVTVTISGPPGTIVVQSTAEVTDTNLGAGQPTSGSPPSPDPAYNIDMFADTNRDTKLDALDEANKGTWTKKSGAIFIVNYDDDDGNHLPDAVDFDNQGKPVNENKVIENLRDMYDQTSLVIRKTGTLPDGAKLFLKVGDKEQAQSVHIFPSLAPGTASILGDLGDRVGGKPADMEKDITPYVKPDQDVTFGIEGMFYRFAGPDAPAALRFAGYLGLTLELRDKTGRVLNPAKDTSSVQLKVAPWVMLPNTQASREVWASNMGQGNASFLQDASAANGYNGLDHSNQLHTVDIGPNSNQWFQDHAAIGYTQRPGEDPIWSVIRLPYTHPASQPPINQPPWVKEKLLASKTGVFQLGSDFGGDGDYGGNIQVVPPTPKNKLGQIVVGDNISPRLFEFLESQEVQPVFKVPVQWLDLGHTDEIFGFDARNGAPIQVFAASPDAAYTQMKAIPAAERGAAVFFSTGSTQTGTVPAGAVIHPGYRIQTGIDLSGPTGRNWKYIRIYADGGSGAAGQIAQIINWGDGWVEVEKVWKTTTKLATNETNTVWCAGHWAYWRGQRAAPSRPPEVAPELWYIRPATGDKFVLIQDTQFWKSGTPAAVTVEEALADDNLKKVSEEVQKQIDIATARLVEKAGGAKELQVKNLPVLFTGRPPKANEPFDTIHTEYAITPNLANFQPIAGNDYFPRQFGPRDATGKDLFEAAAKLVAPNALFVDDWFAYHRNNGEVHCGSLVKRTPFNVNWWDNQP